MVSTPSATAEAWRTAVDALWDRWVLAEIESELALYLWRTAPVGERAKARREYAASLRREANAANLLARALRA
jgi:hypothetical protein